MKIYKVLYLDSLGKERNIIQSAKDYSELVDMISNQNGHVIKAKESKDSKCYRKALPLKHLSIFTYQLYSMLRGGISLVEAFEILQSSDKKIRNRNLYRSILECLQKGNSLSKSLLLQGKVFDSYFISLVEIGEQSGNLELTLKNLSETYKKKKKTQDKIRSASIYPLILLLVSTLVVLILVLYVLPGIVSNFSYDELPLSTKLLLSFANFLLGKWWVIVIVLIIVLMTFNLLLQFNKVRYVLSRHLLYIPYVGRLLRTLKSSRVAESLSILYSQGISGLEMIDLTAQVIGNTFLKASLLEIKLEILYGSSLSQALSGISEFDPLLASMIRVGEETGQLDSLMIQTSEYYSGEAEDAINRMVGLVEPVMILTMGVSIGFIVISIIQPIFKMYETIS